MTQKTHVHQNLVESRGEVDLQAHNGACVSELMDFNASCACKLHLPEKRMNGWYLKSRVQGAPIECKRKPDTSKRRRKRINSFHKIGKRIGHCVWLTSLCCGAVHCTLATTFVGLNKITVINNGLEWAPAKQHTLVPVCDVQ